MFVCPSDCPSVTTCSLFILGSLSLSSQERQSQKYLIFFLALTGAQSVKMLCVHVHPGHYALVHSRSLLRSSREQASKPECWNASKPACEMLESISVGAMPCKGLLRNIAGQFQTGCAGVRKRAKAVSSHAACTMYNTVAGHLFGNEGECSCLKDCGCIRDPDH